MSISISGAGSGGYRACGRMSKTVTTLLIVASAAFILLFVLPFLIFGLGSAS